MTFFKAMGDRLATRPMMNLRQDPLFFDAIRSAVLCAGNCRTQALDCLSSFITVWEAKIADEIAKVGRKDLHTAAADLLLRIGRVEVLILCILYFNRSMSYNELTETHSSLQCLSVDFE
jgi:hypothetical protein